jgi:hypothetical protein
LPDKPVPESAPLSDWEVADQLHRLAFDLQPLRGATERGENALRFAHRLLINWAAALYLASEKGQTPPLPLPPE